MLLISTTNGWNHGDDIIREGVLNLLNLKEEPAVWLNRAEVYAEDSRRHKYLFNQQVDMGNYSELVRHATMFLVAGTPSWRTNMLPIYKLCLHYGIPVWIVGVGNGFNGHGDSKAFLPVLEALYVDGLLHGASVRDTAAKDVFDAVDIPVKIFLDPAVHSKLRKPLPNSPRYIFNPKLCDGGRIVNEQGLELWRKLWSHLQRTPRRGNIRIIAHNAAEYILASQTFDEDILYHSDYRMAVRLYANCYEYIGGRMHGAIPALISGCSRAWVYNGGQKYEELKRYAAHGFPCTVFTDISEIENMDYPNDKIDITALIAEDKLSHSAWLRAYRQ
jgi:hypothetical protein